MKTRSEEVLDQLIDLIKQNQVDKVVISHEINTDQRTGETSPPRCVNQIKITSADLRDALWALAEDVNLSRKVSQKLSTYKE